MTFDVVNTGDVVINSGVNTDIVYERMAAVEAELEQLRSEKVKLSEELTNALQKIATDAAKTTASDQRLQKDLYNLKTERDVLAEQVLELEEAENDARLMSQRLQSQLRSVCDQVDQLQAALMESRAVNEQQAARQRVLEVSERSLSKQLEEIHAIVESTVVTSAGQASTNGPPNGVIRVADKVDERLLAKIADIDSQLANFRSGISGKQMQADKETDQNSSSTSVDDDDLQMFISTDEMAPSGSSFEPSSLTYKQVSKNDSTSTQQLSISLPLCETVRPKKIDLSPNSAQKSSPSAVQTLLDLLSSLATNEKQLRERLHQLEQINRDFVHELELRESILTERNAICSEDLVGLEIELRDLTGQLVDIRCRRDELCEERDRVRRDVERRRQETRPQRPPRNSRVSTVKITSDSMECASTSSDSSPKSSTIALFVPLAIDEALIKLESRLEQLETQTAEILEKEKQLVEQVTLRRDQIDQKQNSKRSELAEIERRQAEVANSLAIKMRDMEANASRTVSQLEDERRQLWRGLEMAARDFVSRESAFTDRLLLVETAMIELKESTKEVEEMASELEAARQELEEEKSASVALRRELQEAAGKEVAFRETLAKADGIVANLEKGYKERVEELEANERELKSRIAQLEDHIETLTTTTASVTASRPLAATATLGRHRSLRLSGSDGSTRKQADLLQEIIEAEARECTLRESICRANQSERQLRDKCRLLESARDELEHELVEHYELLQQTVQLQTQIENLRRELTESRSETDAVRRQVTETENFFALREKVLQANLMRTRDDCQQLRQRITELTRHPSINLCEDDRPSLSDEINAAVRVPSKEPVVKDLSETNLVRRAVNSLEMRLRQQKQHEHRHSQRHVMNTYGSVSGQNDSATSDEKAFSSLDSTLTNCSTTSSHASSVPSTE